MGNSRHLDVYDAQAVFAVTQECLDQWSDPAAWQRHVLQRATALSGCRIGLCYEVADTVHESAGKLLSAADVGWIDEAERRTLIEGIGLKALSYSPLWVNMTQAISRIEPLTRRQHRLLDDDLWLRSDIYDRHVRATRIGRAIMSAIWMPHRSTWSVWCLTNDRSDGELTDRQEELIGLMHEAIAPLIGTRLCAAHQRSLDGVSTRRREVLALLLAGRTEKEIARQLYRSPAAVHEHVAKLYQHFAVGSRSELSAYFIARRPAESDHPARFDGREWLNLRLADERP